MSQQQSEKKIGHDHARGMLRHGMVELRNAASFENSNIAEDIRWSMPRDNDQSQNQGQGQQQAQQQEQRLER